MMSMRLEISFSFSTQKQKRWNKFTEMKSIKVSYVDPSKINHESMHSTILSSNKQIFNYPCLSTFNCTEYDLTLRPGLYFIELFGASGGYDEDQISLFQKNWICLNPSDYGIHSNIDCNTKQNTAGAGGYTSGTIRLRKTTRAFLSIGGKGLYDYKIQEEASSNCYKKENMMEGGYNGGGWASNWFNVKGTATRSGAGSGGGATDIRFEENDLFHRVLVAGGGGGTDNADVGDNHGDDGSGGAGGGQIAQGFFINGVEDTKYVANQTNGFTFGYGESAQEFGSLNENGNHYSGNSDKAGAGGGWFGGWASQNANGGASGGSSFALTSSSIKNIPQNEIEVRDSFYTFIDNQKYAFLNQDQYFFSSYTMIPGVWKGNGYAVIELEDGHLSKGSFALSKLVRMETYMAQKQHHYHVCFNMICRIK